VSGVGAGSTKQQWSRSLASGDFHCHQRDRGGTLRSHSARYFRYLQAAGTTCGPRTWGGGGVGNCNISHVFLCCARHQIRIWVVKSKRMSLAEHVAYMGKNKYTVTSDFVRSLEGCAIKRKKNCKILSLSKFRRYLLPACSGIYVLFCRDRGLTVFNGISSFLSDYTASHSARQYFSEPPPCSANLT
jgi:hypothetical protein